MNAAANIDNAPKRYAQLQRLHRITRAFYHGSPTDSALCRLCCPPALNGTWRVRCGGWARSERGWLLRAGKESRRWPLVARRCRGVAGGRNGHRSALTAHWGVQRPRVSAAALRPEPGTALTPDRRPGSSHGSTLSWGCGESQRPRVSGAAERDRAGRLCGTTGGCSCGRCTLAPSSYWGRYVGSLLYAG